MPLLGNPTVRAALAVAALSAWLVLLFAGRAGGGAVHALLVAALVLFPWRTASAPVGSDPDGGTPPEDTRS